MSVDKMNHEKERVALFMYLIDSKDYVLDKELLEYSIFSSGSIRSTYKFLRGNGFPILKKEFVRHKGSSLGEDIWIPRRGKINIFCLESKRDLLPTNIYQLKDDYQ